MRKLLIDHSYWISSGILLSTLLLFSFSLSSFKSLLRGIGWRTWICLLLLFLLTLVFRVYFIPHTHYVFFDEFAHPEIAKNMLYEHAFYWNPLGNGCGMFKRTLPQWPPGYFFLLSLVFGVFGTSEYVSFLFTSFMGSLNVAAMFILGFLLFDNRSHGLWMAFLLAIYPLHMKFCGSSSLEVVSLLFLTMSLICILVFLKTMTTRILLFSIAMMSLASLMRVENTVLLSAMCGVCLFIHYHHMRNPKILALAVIIAFFLSFLGVAFLTQGLKLYKGWRESQIGYPFFQSMSFWFKGELQPITFTALSLTGLIPFCRSNKLISVGLFAHLLMFLVIYTLFHRLDISGGDMQRFNLQICLPMIIFMVAGSQWAVRILGRGLGKRGVVSSILIICILLTNVYLKFDRVKQPFSEDRQKLYEFILSAKDMIKEDSIVFAPLPASITSTIGRVACSTDLLVENFSKDWMVTPSKWILFKDILFSLPDSKQFGQFLKIKHQFALKPILETKIGENQIGFYSLEKL